MYKVWHVNLIIFLQTWHLAVSFNWIAPCNSASRAYVLYCVIYTNVHVHCCIRWSKRNISFISEDLNMQSVSFYPFYSGDLRWWCMLLPGKASRPFFSTRSVLDTINSHFTKPQQTIWLKRETLWSCLEWVRSKREDTFEPRPRVRYFPQSWKRYTFPLLKLW